ncbi:MAG TPA: 2,3-diaminopropionate biosynthesis protein SbnA [Blastocatellia bacterium]
MNQGILSVIGNTPLIELVRVLAPSRFRLYAKLESFNPGGSMKDRPALNIISSGLRSGKITSETVIIESSSGNMGVGLAQACSYFGLKLICVVDSKTTPQNIRLLQAYGAQVDLVSDPDPSTGEYLQARLNRVKELSSIIPNAYWPNQYANPENPAAHRQTMREIFAAFEEQVYCVFCATSTCGTLRGCAEYISEHRLNTRLVAVDAVGSVIFGSPVSKRLVSGHGSAIRPPLFQPDLAHEFVLVDDLDCVIGCRRLASTEAILAGGSSGAIISAIDRISDAIPDGATCVAILPDRGERYLDTIFSDQWVSDHFGDVSHLWKTPPEGSDIESERCAIAVS